MLKKLTHKAASVADWCYTHRKPLSIVASACLTYINPHLDLVWIKELGAL